ncbi:hypothetical protein QTP88_022498 [Uroleucon formosanum]
MDITDNFHCNMKIIEIALQLLPNEKEYKKSSKLHIFSIIMTIVRVQTSIVHDHTICILHGAWWTEASQRIRFKV